MRWPIDQISGRVPFLVEERVVWRRLPVGSDVHELAEEIGRVLRLVAQVEALSEGHEQIAAAIEDEPRSPMVIARMRRLLPENHLCVLKRRAGLVEPAARDAGSGPALAAFLGETQENETVLRSPGDSATSSNPPWPLACDLRNPAKRRGHLAVGGHDAQPPGPFRHEHSIVGKKRDAPRVLEIPRHGLDDHLDLVGPHPLAVLRHGVGCHREGECADICDTDGNHRLSYRSLLES